MLHGQTLLNAFERCELSPDSFRHAQHIEVAWLYVRRYPLIEAMSRSAVGIERMARALGAPDKFHATITSAFVLLVAQRAAASDCPDSWPDFERDNPDLFMWPSPVLAHYYTDATLWSDAARHQFVLPDKF